MYFPNGEDKRSFSNSVLEGLLTIENIMEGYIKCRGNLQCWGILKHNFGGLQSLDVDVQKVLQQ